MSSKRVRCIREGCPGSVTEEMCLSGRSACSVICQVMATEFELLQAACQKETIPGRSSKLTDQWTALVEASDALTEYQRARHIARGFAMMPD